MGLQTQEANYPIQLVYSAKNHISLQIEHTVVNESAYLVFTAYSKTHNWLSAGVPNVQPSLRQPQEATTSRQVISKRDCTPLDIQTRDVVLVSGAWAQSTARALIKEGSNALLPPGFLNCQAIFQHMPKNKLTLKVWDISWTCLEDIGEGTWRRLGQAGHDTSLPKPGLGALWPRGGWSISHCDITWRIYCKNARHIERVVVLYGVSGATQVPVQPASKVRHQVLRIQYNIIQYYP